MTHTTRTNTRSDRERVTGIVSRHFTDEEGLPVWEYGRGLNGRKTLVKTVEEFTVICPECTNKTKRPVVCWVDHIGDDICPECGLVCTGDARGKWVTYQTPLGHKPEAQ